MNKKHQSVKLHVYQYIIWTMLVIERADWNGRIWLKTAGTLGIKFNNKANIDDEFLNHRHNVISYLAYI
jgi:hypothetical protein